MVRTKNANQSKYKFLFDTSSSDHAYYQYLLQVSAPPPPPPPAEEEPPPPPPPPTPLPPVPSALPAVSSFPSSSSFSSSSSSNSSASSSDPNSSAGKRKRRGWDVPPAQSAVTPSPPPPPPPSSFDDGDDGVALDGSELQLPPPPPPSLSTDSSSAVPGKKKRNRFSEGPPVPFTDGLPVLDADAANVGSAGGGGGGDDAPPPVPLTQAELALAKMNAVFNTMRQVDQMRSDPEEMDDATKRGKGTHHVGDYLPTGELNKFMMKAKGLKVPVEQGDKISAGNKGFQMLNKMGWQEGSGLGRKGTGIAVPINAGGQTTGLGVGAEAHGTVKATDDPFTQYKKRMALSYKFRPNPLGNPRAAYWDQEAMNAGATPDLELNPLTLEGKPT